MKADPEAQRRLLDLQAIDTALAQLAHRRKTLPELAELDRLAREVAALDDERVRAQVAVDDLDRDIARMEKDVEQVRVRADRDRTRLDVGTGPAKELEALQHELATLSRRQGELEDAELELMEQREQAQATLDEVAARLTAVREPARRDRGPTGRRHCPNWTETGTGSRRSRAPLVGRPAGRPGAALREDPRVDRHRRGAAARRALRGLPAGAVRLGAVPGQGGRARRGDPLRGVPADPGPYQRVRPVSGADGACTIGAKPRARLKVIVEADGGSRGNPGPAGYGAVVREAATGEVLLELGERIGVATNNVAEYRGLMAGLRAAADLGAVEVEVRMDSKLVVEQMSGRWQIKHPGLRPLAAEAATLVRRFDSVRFTWVPREQNRAADALANAAMDGKPLPATDLAAAADRGVHADRRPSWSPPPAGRGDPAGPGPARRDRLPRSDATPAAAM